MPMVIHRNKILYPMLPCIFTEAAGLIRHLLTVNPAKRATITEICSHWWVNLGHSLMPDNEPYAPPMVPQPIPSFHNQPLSSSSSESEAELDTDSTCKPKTVKPLKGILKKPKMAEEKTKLSDIKWCNDIVMPNIDMNEKETLNDMPFKDEDCVFKDTVDAQSTSICDNHSQTEILSNDLLSTDASEATESAKKVPFDSQVMPKRGILKRKGKFSTGDSGCDLNDSSRKDSVNLSVRPMDLGEADSALDSPNSSSANEFSPPTITTSDSLATFSLDANEPQTTKPSIVVSDSVTTSTVIPRRWGMKNYNRDSDKRLSACSIGSNSSADILDFSYDSSDEVLARFCRTPSKNMLDVDTDVIESTPLPDDLFNYDEAREICKKALEICKHF